MHIAVPHSGLFSLKTVYRKFHHSWRRRRRLLLSRRDAFARWNTDGCTSARRLALFVLRIYVRFSHVITAIFRARPGRSCGERRLNVVLRDASRVITRGNATPQFRAAANRRANAQITSAIAADFEAHTNNGNGYTANCETRTRCKEPRRQAQSFPP
jgi:hypothetical protein